MNRTSRPSVSNSRSTCYNFIVMDEAALSRRLIVVDFMVELSLVLLCAR